VLLEITDALVRLLMSKETDVFLVKRNCEMFENMGS